MIPSLLSPSSSSHSNNSPNENNYSQSYHQNYNYPQALNDPYPSHSDSINHNLSQHIYQHENESVSVFVSTKRDRGVFESNGNNSIGHNLEVGGSQLNSNPREKYRAKHRESDAKRREKQNFLKEKISDILQRYDPNLKKCLSKVDLLEFSYKTLAAMLNQVNQKVDRPLRSEVPWLRDYFNDHNVVILIALYKFIDDQPLIHFYDANERFCEEMCLRREDVINKIQPPGQALGHALCNPTAQSIIGLKKLQAGQMDECEIAMRITGKKLNRLVYGTCRAVRDNSGNIVYQQLSFTCTQNAENILVFDGDHKVPFLGRAVIEPPPLQLYVKPKTNHLQNDDHNFNPNSIDIDNYIEQWNSNSSSDPCVYKTSEEPNSLTSTSVTRIIHNSVNPIVDKDLVAPPKRIRLVPSELEQDLRQSSYHNINSTLNTYSTQNNTYIHNHPIHKPIHNHPHIISNTHHQDNNDNNTIYSNNNSHHSTHNPIHSNYSNLNHNDHHNPSNNNNGSHDNPQETNVGQSNVVSSFFNPFEVFASSDDANQNHILNKNNMNNSININDSTVNSPFPSISQLNPFDTNEDPFAVIY